jgi:hypothetical protein
MFYDGKGGYRFRFSGTKTGTWKFTTRSDDADLHGKRGTVTIRPNDNRRIRGFMTDHVGPDATKWARYVDGDGGKEAFVPQLVMYKDKPHTYHDKPDERKRDALLAGRCAAKPRALLAGRAAHPRRHARAAPGHDHVRGRRHRRRRPGAHHAAAAGRGGEDCSEIVEGS